MRVRPGWAHAVLAAAILAGCSGSPSLQYLTGAPAGVRGMDAGTTVIGHAVGDLDLEAMVPPGVTAGLADSPTCRKLGAGQVVEATINTSMFMSYQMLACIRGRTPTRPSGT